MAQLTNAQKVRRLASQTGGSITSKAFFTSPEVGKYFSDKVMGLTKRYENNARVPVKMLWEDEEQSAYTNHAGIFVNANWHFYSGMQRPQKFLVMHGVVYHEAAHILYTDLKYKMMCYGRISSGELFPEPIVEHSRVSNILAEGKHNKSFASIWNLIRNALEDGYIEYRFLEEYRAPQYSDGMEAMRKAFRNGLKSLEEMKSDEGTPESILFSILNILLEYAKFGCLPYKNQKEMQDERIQAVVRCIPYIDEVNATDEPESHYRAINSVVALLGDYIAGYLETLPEEDGQQGGAGNGDAPGAAGEGSGGNDAGIPKELEQALSEIAKAGGLDEGRPESGDGENGTPFGGTPLSAPRKKDGTGQIPEPGGNGNGVGNTPGGVKPKPGEGDTQMQMPPSVQEEEQKLSGGAVEKAGADMQKLLDGIAEKNAARKLEQEAATALNNENSSFVYGDIHKGVECEIIRETEVPESAVEAYNNVKPDIDRLVRATVKGLKQVLKDRSAGSVQKGLYFGRDICPTSYSRYDKKYFRNRKLPADYPAMSIALVIDESGSMSGRKITAARIMSAVVYRFCIEMGIRVMIVGHTASNRHVDIHTYCDFGGCYDGNDIYRLMGIHSRYNNRDGYVNRYAAEKLKKEPSDIKMCIIVSDGAPNDSGYRGEAAYEDMRRVKKDAQHHNIGTIVAAIDDDKEDIKKIYGEECFLDITDLDKLPAAICAAIRKNLPL